MLEVSWPPERLYYLEQQSGDPYTLVYGKLGAPAARFTESEFRAISLRVENGEIPISPTATLGSRVELRGRAALEPESSSGLPVRTLLLWGVLLGSVAIVGGLGSVFFLEAARTLREDLAAVVD